MFNPMTGQCTLDQKDLKINWKFFNKILEANDFTKMNALEICSAVYERTYIHYGFRFLEENHRAEELTKRVVNKVTELEDLKQAYREAIKYGEEKGIKYPDHLSKLGAVSAESGKTS